MWCAEAGVLLGFYCWLFLVDVRFLLALYVVAWVLIWFVISVHAEFVL